MRISDWSSDVCSSDLLPKLFAVMPGGRWLGVAFLAAFVLMAFLSALAALEVGLVGLRDVGGGRWSRRRMALALFVVEAVLMLPSARSEETSVGKEGVSPCRTLWSL